MKTKKTKKYAVGGYQPVGLPVSSADIRADKRQTQKDAGFWKDFGKFVSERVLPMAGPIGAGIGAVASMGLSKGFEPARYTADMPNNYAVDTTPQLPAQELQLNTGQNNGLGFKSGGSIHINPANKGKFNATKKRTGKTTEELTHSKNPLTRKRAIFAQNAAKWHHETGGPITPIVQDSIPAFKYMPTVTNPSQVNSTATPIFTGLPEVKPVMPDLMGDAIREAASYGGFRGSSLKVKSKDRYREHATGGPVKPLQFVGRSLTHDPAKWLGPNNAKGVFGITDSNRFSPEQLTMGANITRASDATPYMLVSDNIYYNPYDKVFNSRNDKGEYIPIETSRTFTRRRQPGSKLPIDKKHVTDVAEQNRWERANVQNPYFPEVINISDNEVRLYDSLTNKDMNLNVKEHLKKYPKHATGGDIQLNSGAFQVQGNAQTTDGNKYNMGGENVALDHNEVVRDNFVFSDILTNPLTGNKFSKDAKVIEKKIGKSEKKIQAYNDLISKKTLNHLKGMSKDLEKVHEVVATSKGMRNSDGSTKQHFATGGTVDGPGPGYIQMEDNNWYNPNTGSILMSLDGKYVPVIEAADFLIPQYNQSLQLSGQYSTDQVSTNPLAHNVAQVDTIQPATQSTSQNWDRFPVWGDSVGYKGPMKWRAPGTQPPVKTVDQILNDRLYGDPYATPDSTLSENAPIGTGTAPTASILGTTPGTSTPKKATTPAKVRPTIVPPSVGGFYNPAPAEGNRTMPDGSVVPDYLLPNNTTPYNPQQTPEQRAAATEHMPFIWDTQKDAYNKPWKTDEGRQAGLTAGDTTTTPPPNADQYRTPFTAGDALQGIGAFSKFAQALSGVEQEPTRANTAPITKQVYDPRAPLYQNQRNFSNALNSIQAGSLNTRRAVASQLFANKLNSDSSILDRYSQMNLGARTQYEQRLADRQRENIGYANYASDLNARNRAARTNNLDVAFDTLSNFGASLNQKKQAADMINIYRKLFPSIEKNILSALG